jgi:hypothetical protein
MSLRLCTPSKFWKITSTGDNVQSTVSIILFLKSTIIDLVEISSKIKSNFKKLGCGSENVISFAASVYTELHDGTDVQLIYDTICDCIRRASNVLM